MKYLIRFAVPRTAYTPEQALISLSDRTEPSGHPGGGPGGLRRGLIYIRTEQSNPGNDPGGPSRAAAAGARAEPIRPDFGRARSKKDRSNCQK